MYASSPNEPGQLFDPQVRPPLHWLSKSQSPSSSEQEWQAQNPIFPLVTFTQLTEKKFQKDLNNNLPHEAIYFIQNSSWKLG